jgi:hypothetical protein
MASNVFYQLHESSPAEPGTHSETGTTDLCCVLQSLVEDVLAVYLKAEKMQWHLRLHRPEEGGLAGTAALADVMHELCASALSAMLQLGCSMQNRSSGEDVHFAQFINAVAALRAGTQTSNEGRRMAIEAVLDTAQREDALGELSFSGKT